ncbi:hypothetical protein LTR95_002005 [Oleoguttula sp. CCFEE 5521]
MFHGNSTGAQRFLLPVSSDSTMLELPQRQAPHIRSKVKQPIVELRLGNKMPSMMFLQWQTIIESDKKGVLRHPDWPRQYTKPYAGLLTKEMHNARVQWAVLLNGRSSYVAEEDEALCLLDTDATILSENGVVFNKDRFRNVLESVGFKHVESYDHTIIFGLQSPNTLAAPFCYKIAPVGFTDPSAYLSTKCLLLPDCTLKDAELWRDYMRYIVMEDPKWPREYDPDDIWLDMSEDTPQLQIRARDYYDLPRPPVLALQECMDRHGFTLEGTGFNMTGWDVSTTAITARSFAAKGAAQLSTKQLSTIHERKAQFMSRRGGDSPVIPPRFSDLQPVELSSSWTDDTLDVILKARLSTMWSADECVLWPDDASDLTQYSS